MSSPIARKRYAKAQIDQSVADAFRRAAGHVHARRSFDRLLKHVHARSSLLRPYGPAGRIDVSGACEYVTALLALAYHHHAWCRPVESWSPADEGSRPQFAALARHLLADWPVPGFMTSVWFKGCNDAARRQQEWFALIGRGGNIRKAAIPLPFTKLMAHHFILAPEDLDVEAALRWGQVRGLGGSSSLARAFTSTRLGREFAHEDFWESVVCFFIRHPEIDLEQVSPIVEFLHEQKFVPQELLVEEDELGDLGPAQPYLSMSRRTPRALLRQVDDWQRRKKLPPRLVGVRWNPSGIGELRFVEPDQTRGVRRWTTRELLSGGELHREGKAMRHCVGSYVSVCVRKVSSIWSLRFDFDGRRHRVMTMEVDLATRTIRQARLRGNGLPNSKIRSVMQQWAHQEGLVIGESL